VKIEIIPHARHVQRQTDYSKFEPILDALKVAIATEQGVVQVTCDDEVEAIQLHKWALKFGRYRSDDHAVKLKRKHGLCIASRWRTGNIVTLFPAKDFLGD
jgi:hypothetical protein